MAHAELHGPEYAGVSHVVLDVVGAGRMAPEDDAVRIAAMLGDVGPGPGDGGLEVLGAGRPRVLGGQAIVDVDTNHAVVHRPGQHVVGLLLVPADEAAAVHEDHHRPGLGGFGGRLQDVDLLERVGAGRHVTGDGDAGVGLLGLQGRVERAHGEIDLPGRGFVLGGDVGRHLGLGRCEADRDRQGHAGAKDRSTHELPFLPPSAAA